MKALLKFIFILAIIVIFIYGFSSSFISHSLENLAYVIGIGIDKNTDDDKELKVSFQFLQLSALSDASSTESPTVIISTATANSITEAFNLMNTYIGKELNLAHCDLIVFSSEYAETGINQEIYSLINNDNMRPTTNLIVCKESAEKYLQNVKPNIEKLVTKYYDTFSITSGFTGYTQDVTIGSFYNKLGSDSWDNTISLAEVFEPKSEPESSSSGGGESGGSSGSTGGEKGSSSGGGESGGSSDSSGGEKSSSSEGGESGSSGSGGGESGSSSGNDESKKDSTSSLGTTGKRGTQNVGVAVFKDDKLIGELSGPETIYHLLMLNKLQSCVISVPISKSKPDDNIDGTIDLYFSQKSKTKISVDTNGDNPTINIDIFLDADILTIEDSSNYDTQDNLNLLSYNAETYLNNSLNSYLTKISKELKCDIDGFANFAKRNFLTVSDWKSYDWKSKYENANFVVNSHVNVNASIY